MLDSIMKKLKRGVSSHAMGGPVAAANDHHHCHDHHGGCCGHDHAHDHHHEEKDVEDDSCSTKPGKGECC